MENSINSQNQLPELHACKLNPYLIGIVQHKIYNLKKCLVGNFNPNLIGIMHYKIYLKKIFSTCKMTFLSTSTTL